MSPSCINLNLGPEGMVGTDRQREALDPASPKTSEPLIPSEGLEDEKESIEIGLELVLDEILSDSADTERLISFRTTTQLGLATSTARKLCRNPGRTFDLEKFSGSDTFSAE